MIAAGSGSNFFRSFSLLRPDRRRGMMALYAFARLVDDWGDSPRVNPSPTTGDGCSTAWHAWIESLTRSVAAEWSHTVDVPHDSAIAPATIRLAMADTIERFRIPARYLHELVDGVSLDREGPIQVKEREELERYCYLVASSVGLACLCIWGGDVAKLEGAAIQCGVAFQLTNILRDVRDDARQGRLYVPQVWLAEHQVDTSTWLAGKPNGDWQSVVSRMIDWADQAYRVGWTIQPALDEDAQRMFSLMWRTYRRLLDRIQKDPKAIWQQRVGLSSFEKTSLYLRHAITPWYRR